MFALIRMILCGIATKQGSMPPGRWERVKEVFTEALEQAPDTREAFARQACRTDGELLQEVLKLLHGYNRASGTLSSPMLPTLLGQMPEDPPRFLPSTIVAHRFRTIRLIARGGMGEVYEAEDLQLGVRLALKTIRPDIAADGRVLDLFKNEIQSARRVTHPNVCRIYDLAQHSEPTAGDSDQVTVFLTMELLSGETLSEHLKTYGRFSPEEAVPLICQMASALQAAHEAGVIHRDFKPGNVMLVPGTGKELRVVVTDFGLAVARGQARSNKLLPGAAGGTPAYMAPEQVQGGEITTATDVYALGLVIAEMIGARVQPASASRLGTILHRAPTSFGVEVRLARAFRRWEHVLLRCLEADPCKRYSRPIAVTEALARESARRPVLTRRMSFATAAALLAAVLWLSESVAQRYTKWHPPNLTTYRKLGRDDPAITLWRPSPDGRYFAVTDWRTGNLGLRDIATGEIRLLTNKSRSPYDAQALSAVFSPDGNRIVYTWLQNTGYELRMIDTRDGKDALLYRDPGLRMADLEDWSADGARILAHLYWPDYTDQIAVISVSDHSVLFPQSKGTYGSMIFAPDSAHMIFTAPRRAGEFESEIYEVPIQGGAATTLVQNPANDDVIGFSADGRWLVFSSDRRGLNGLWAVAFSEGGTAGQPEELAHDFGRANPIGLTRDGALYYTLATDSQDVYTAEIDVATGQLLSGPDNVVKRFTGSFRFPGWSADGRRLSFMSVLDPRQPVIGVYSRDTGEIHNIAVKLAQFWRPQWDPSGEDIFVLGTDANRQRGIFRVHANTGDAELAIAERSLGSGFEGVWSRDGRTMFNRFSNASRGLFRIDVVTGERHVLFVPPRNTDLGLENLALSPDERVLAFQLRQQISGASSLMLIPTTGGPARELLTIKKPESFPFGSFAWSADSKQVLAVRTRDEKSELWLVPVGRGEARKVEFPSMGIAQLRMNPDGRTIAFMSGKESGEVWVAENLLPAKTN